MQFIVCKLYLNKIIFLKLKSHNLCKTYCLAYNRYSLKVGSYFLIFEGLLSPGQGLKGDYMASGKRAQQPLMIHPPRPGQGGQEGLRSVRFQWSPDALRWPPAVQQAAFSPCAPLPACAPVPHSVGCVSDCPSVHLFLAQVSPMM